MDVEPETWECLYLREVVWSRNTRKETPGREVLASDQGLGGMMRGSTRQGTR